MHPQGDPGRDRGGTGRTPRSGRSGLPRHLPSADERQARIASGQPHALRLDLAKAIDTAGPLTWLDVGQGEQQAAPEVFGDAVLARKDIACAYHLAVTLDDADQGVTLVTRGQDLFEASHLHRLLMQSGGI